MTLGELVHTYREEHGMTMQEFADRSQLSKAYISMLERNRNPKSGKPPVPSLETIRAISRVIGADFGTFEQMSGQGEQCLRREPL